MDISRNRGSENRCGIKNERNNIIKKRRQTKLATTDDGGKRSAAQHDFSLNCLKNCDHKSLG